LVIAAAVSPHGLADDFPKRYEVLGLNKAYQLPTNSTYMLTEHSLADVLNLALGPLFWADEACDLGRYVDEYKEVSRIVLGSIEQKRDPAESQLRALLEALPDIPLDQNGPERYRQRYCEIFLAKDGYLDPQLVPKHSITLEVPCLVPVRADKSDLLWCSRRAIFYSEAMRTAVEAAMKKARDLFVACGSIDAYRSRYEPMWSEVYSSVVETNDNALADLRDGIVDEYDLRRNQRASMADEMIRTDRDLIVSLLLAYSVPRFSTWCTVKGASAG
jgi:hypothetical protein